MSDINSVVLAGRLTREGAVKFLPSGQPVVNFTIAVNRSRKRDDGRWEDEPSFIDCVYFGKAAEAVNPYLEKGRQVIIQGELRQSKWEVDGQQRSKIEIVVSNLSLGQQAQGSSQRQGGYNRPQPAQRATQRPVEREKIVEINEGGPEDFEDDNIPF